MKYIKFAIEIFLEDVGYSSVIHFVSKWDNVYILYFKNDNIKSEPLKIIPIVDNENDINKFEYKLLKKNILLVANECIQFLKE